MPRPAAGEQGAGACRQGRRTGAARACLPVPRVGKGFGGTGYDWVSDADEMYSLAARYAGDVLNNQTVYRLDPDLGNVYDVEHQADGVEHIFMTSMNREASGMEGTYSQLPQMFSIQTGSIVYVSSSLGKNSREVMKFLDYESGYQVMRVDNDFRNTYDDDDLRKQLMVTTIYNEDGSVLATYDPSTYQQRQYQEQVLLSFLPQVYRPQVEGQPDVGQPLPDPFRGGGAYLCRGGGPDRRGV